MRFTACALAFFAQPLLAEKSSIDGVKLMTLNVAHARATGMFQMLQSTVQAEAHLHDIVRLIRREQPDIVAFQEIDKNAFWTGRVDQMQLIAEKSEYIHWFTGSHQSGGFLNYGTGLMSKHPLSNPISITFRKPFARLRKGFVLSVVDWPEIENTKVDVISVHLDFLSTSERRQEMNTLQNLLAGRQNLRIVMGDFNTEFDHDAGLIRNLTNELGLRAWKPQSKELVTFPKLDKRIDWVLVSDEFTFLRHRILPDPVSDHNAVIVTVTLLNSALAEQP